MLITRSTRPSSITSNALVPSPGSFSTGNAIDPDFDEALGGTFGRVDREPELLDDQPGLVRKAVLIGNRAERKQHACSREPEAGGEQAVQESLVEIGAQAADLSCAAHLYAQHRVGAHDTREGKHGDLHAHVVERKCFVRHLAPQPQHSIGRLGGKVRSGDLGNERKAARSPQIAFDDLHCTELGQKLHVEGAGDVQLLRDSQRRCGGFAESFGCTASAGAVRGSRRRCERRRLRCAR